MPLYSFRCPECGRRFEELLTVEHKDRVPCPDCGAKAEREWTGKCSFGAKYASSRGERPAECANCPMCGH